MGTHARLSPSNHRWPHCPGSIREEAPYPDISGEAAIDGTGTHLLVELCLKNQRLPESYVNERIGVGDEEKPGGWLVDAERAERASMMINYLRRRYKELTGYRVELKVEKRVDPGSMYGRDDWDGTSDIVLYVWQDIENKESRMVEIETSDYKDGRLYVSADNNSQLQSYALGAIAPVKRHLSADCKVRMSIVQPKSTTPIRYQDTTAKELLVIGMELAKAAARTDAPDAPLIPDEKEGKGYCRWCKHKDNCEALNNIKIEKVKKVENQLDIKEMLLPAFDVKSLTNEQLGSFLSIEKEVKKAFENVESEIEARLNAGEVFDEWVLGSGRVTKVWNEDDETIAKALKGRRLKLDEVMPRKLATPAQILKSENLDAKQKEKIMNQYITEKCKTKVIRVKKSQSLFVEGDGIPEALISEPVSPVVVADVATECDSVVDPTVEEFSFI